MSSLGDIQQIYSLLQEIDQLLSRIEVHSQTTETKVRSTIQSVQRLEQVMLRYLAIAKRMGLPEDIDRAINFVSQMIVTARMLHMSLTVLEMSHPYTLPLAAAGIILTTITFQDSMAGYFT